MFICPCKQNSKAVYYCNKNCTPNTLYYCAFCDEPHDHRTIKIAIETSKNFEICQKLDQEARELFSQILLKEEEFKEFLADAKELCR